MENLIKATKSLQENIGSESFKRMPFVSFFLYMLMAFFVLMAFAELWFTFGLHDVNWINYNVELINEGQHYWINYNVELINEGQHYWGWYFAYVELIIGILSAINAISILFILKSNRKGFYIIAYSCVIAVFILTLYSQYGNTEYNSIGNLVLMKNLFIPFILWAVLNLKNDQGQSQWQYLK